jgi:hypothetical protein
MQSKVSLVKILRKIPLIIERSDYIEDNSSRLLIHSSTNYHFRSAIYIDKTLSNNFTEKFYLEIST